MSRGSARRVLRRARCLGQMPVTAVALADGVLSVDHVDLLARAARGHRRELFVRDEAVLVGVCGAMIWDDAVRAVEYWCSRADADGAGDGDCERGAARGAGAHVHASSTLDGTVVVSGVLDPVGGEVFRNELDRLEHLLYLADLESGSDRTAAQRRAVALVEMATRSATAPADGRRPRPLFVAHVGDETVRQACSGVPAATPRRPCSGRRCVPHSHSGWRVAGHPWPLACCAAAPIPPATVRPGPSSGQAASRANVVRACESRVSTARSWR